MSADSRPFLLRPTSKQWLRVVDRRVLHGYLEGIDAKEIASEVHLTEAQVLKICAKARKMLGCHERYGAIHPAIWGGYLELADNPSWDGAERRVEKRHMSLLEALAQDLTLVQARKELSLGAKVLDGLTADLKEVLGEGSQFGLVRAAFEWGLIKP